MPQRQTFPFIVLAAFVAVFLAPLVVLFSTPISALPVKFVPAVLFSKQTLNVLLTTVFVAGVAAAFRTPLIFFFGWLVNRTDLPGRRIFDSVGLYGMTVPDLMKAVGWLILLNPVNGLINVIFLDLFHAPLFNIFSPAGLAFACIWSDLPFEYLMASAAIKNLDPSLEEMSRASGHSILRTFVSVVLPSLRQIFAIVFVIGFMITFTGFDQAVILAPSGGFAVMSTYIDNQFNTIPPNYSAAATLGILFLLFAVGIFSVYLFLTRRTFMFQTVRGSASRRTVHRLAGAGRLGALGFCSFIVLMTFGLPCMALVWLALTIPGRLFVFSGLTNFVAALHASLFDVSWINSMILGIVVSAIAVPLVVVMAYGVFRSHFRASRLLEYVVILPRGIPDIVYGLAVFLMFILVPGLNYLYGTIIPFVLAVVIVTCPVAIIIVSSAMVQIGDELEDASRVGGAGWTRTFFRVVLPLTRRAILNSIQYAFIGTFNNVASVVLLVTPSFYLLLPLLLGEITANPAAINYVAATSVMITVFLGAFIVGMKIVERKLAGKGEEPQEADE